MKYFVLLALAFLFGLVVEAQESDANEYQAKPNVVVIFADDLGYGDVGCYGATEVQTPNIDRLAREGRRFTDAHSASAVCTPSRYALLTGEYPLRANGGSGVWGPLPITSGLIIDTKTLTIGKVFKNKGYATACLGKWHLGFKQGGNDWQVPLRPGPQDVGFDYYFGIPVVNSAPPYVYVENDTIVGYDIPFIVRWPGKIKAETVSDQLICQVDLLATFMALTGQDVQSLQGKDSINMLPALLDDPDKPLRTELVLAPRQPRNRGIRKNRWVYIGAQGSGGFTGSKPSDHAWGGPAAAAFAGSVNSDIENGRIKKDAPPAQLYDLESDLAQTKNVYQENPEVVQQMEELLKSYRPRTGDVPRKRRPRRRPRGQATQPVSSEPTTSATGPATTDPDAHQLAAGASRLTQQPTHKTAPNFVVIFADDLRYGDISCYSPTGVETPYIDALAAEGFRSTDFFVPANVCSPSRASLLTGRYPMRCGMPVARSEAYPKYKHYGLAPDEVTIPELLKPAGYRSLMVGKWHLGLSNGPSEKS